MRAVTFQAPGDVQLDDVAEPELLAADDAIVRVEASGICGSDLHIYHGRVQIEPGFVIGHEYVGTVVEAGDAVTEIGVGDRVLGTYCTAWRVLLLPPRGVPQVRRRPRIRPRCDARVAAGRPGR